MPIQLGNTKLYSPKEAADFLRVSMPTIRRYVREGRLEEQKVDWQWYVTEESLQKFLHPEGRGEGE